MALGAGDAQAQEQISRRGDEPPNIVLLFADDLGYGDLSSFGHPVIRTPNLDRVGREGIRLTSFYAAAPGCTPSRAALLTGRYPLRTGLWRVLFPDEEEGLPPEEITLAETLPGSYQTMMVGKWHLGHAEEKYLPTSNGFDQYFGLPYSNDMQPPWVDTDVPIPLLRNTEVVEEPVDQTRLTERYTEEATGFIESAAGEAPFFLYLAYSMPHLPLHAPERFRGRSRAGLYGDVVEMIDWSAGRIMKTLERQGVADNTILIFTSDNGPWSNMPERMLQDGIKPWHAGTAGLLRGAKGTTYEGGLRVPAVIRWPARIPAGQVSAEPASTLDLLPTLATAAGGTVPSNRPLDGHDLMPFLMGERERSPRERFFYYQGRQLEAVREGPWKLRIEQTPEGPRPPELYHLDLDPSERFDQADAHPEVVTRLKERMRVMAQEVEGTELPMESE